MKNRFIIVLFQNYSCFSFVTKGSFSAKIINNLIVFSIGYNENMLTSVDCVGGSLRNEPRKHQTDDVQARVRYSLLIFYRKLYNCLTYCYFAYYMFLIVELFVPIKQLIFITNILKLS